MKEFTARCKAFSNEGVRTHQLIADFSDNTILVWDSVAEHYTNCHALSDRQQDRLIKLANAS